MLPNITVADGITQKLQNVFGGYNHRKGAQDGEIYDMKNLTGDEYPLIATRKLRHTIRTLTTPNGMIAVDGLWYVDGTTLYKDGTQKCTGLADSHKLMAATGEQLLIWPDKVAVDLETGAKTEIQVSASQSGVVFSDGTYGGEAAEANTMVFPAAVTGFSAGDGISITGCTTRTANNKDLVIREISDDKKTFRFYENAFDLPSGATSYTEAGTVKIERKAPDLDVLFVHDNRAWGAKGDTIYASKPGDPTNWNVFDGLTSDAYALDVGSAESFTGGCEYMGLAVFFKPSKIYKVYGEKPSNYQALDSATLGVESGGRLSTAIAGEVLFYQSRTGIIAYSGGTPKDISSAFGGVKYTNCVGGSDGVKYYFSGKDASNVWHLFVYDTRTALWHREDNTHVTEFGYSDGMYVLCADGKILCLSDTTAGTAETALASYVEFADVYESSASEKQISKLVMRFEVDTGGSITVKISYNGGTFETVKTISTTAKKSVYLPVIPHRCDYFRIRIEGTGGWALYSIAREDSTGSAVRR